MLAAVCRIPCKRIVDAARVPILIAAVLAPVLVAACGRKAFDGVDAAASADAAPDASADARACVASADCAGATVRMCGDLCVMHCPLQEAYAAAADRCLQWGGQLAKIESATINNCVAAAIPSPGESVARIGLSQFNDATELLSAWRWQDETPMGNYTQWGPSQPDDVDGTESGQENTTLIGLDGSWDDIGGATMFPALCTR